MTTSDLHNDDDDDDADADDAADDADAIYFWRCVRNKICNAYIFFY